MNPAKRRFRGGLVSAIEVSVPIVPHRKRSMVPTAVLIPEPPVPVASDVADVLASGIPQILTVFTDRLATIAPACTTIEVLAGVANVLAIFPLSISAVPLISSILCIRRVGRDQNKAERESNRSNSILQNVFHDNSHLPNWFYPPVLCGGEVNWRSIYKLAINMPDRRA